MDEGGARCVLARHAYGEQAQGGKAVWGGRCVPTEALIHGTRMMSGTLAEFSHSVRFSHLRGEDCITSR